jgi:hypothetical protein
MRKLLAVAGLMVFILGGLGLVGGRILIEQRYEHAGLTFWGGAGMILIGAMIRSAARNKTCSYCQARVDAQVERCDRCGSEF